MYFLIGDDGQQYGPVDAATLREWIFQSRANAETRVRSGESSDWRKLDEFPEFAGVLALPSALSTKIQPGGLSILSGQPAKLNGYALWGFISALAGVPLCMCGIFSLLGLALSVVGLLQTSGQPGSRGKNLAVAGVVISFGALILFVMFWGFAAVMQQSGAFEAPGGSE